MFSNGGCSVRRPAIPIRKTAGKTPKDGVPLEPAAQPPAGCAVGMREALFQRERGDRPDAPWPGQRGAPGAPGPFPERPRRAKGQVTHRGANMTGDRASRLAVWAAELPFSRAAARVREDDRASRIAGHGSRSGGTYVGTTSGSRPSPPSPFFSVLFDLASTTAPRCLERACKRSPEQKRRCRRSGAGRWAKRAGKEERPVRVSRQRDAAPPHPPHPPSHHPTSPRPAPPSSWPPRRRDFFAAWTPGCLDPFPWGRSLIPGRLATAPGPGKGPLGAENGERD